MVIELGPRSYRCAWLVVVGLHVMCAVFLTQLARVYLVIAHPYTETIALLVMGDRYPYLRLASAIIAAASALHWWQLLDILWSSLRSRELVFASVGSSIQSPVFRVVFTVRELVEIISQSFQAQRSSELLPRPWLNHLLIALVVSNCWSTPVIQHFFGHHHMGLERVVCLLLDTMLNIGSCMAIPLAVFLPYYRELSPVTLRFPAKLEANSIWISRFVMENRLLFSLSTSDVLSKLVQHLGIYASLTSAVVLILVHLCFFSWGLALLSIHITVTVKYQQEMQGCSLATAPWFATHYPCSVYNYNCYRHGVASPGEDSWSQLDPGTLLFFAITHCPELKMLRRLQSFQNLMLLHLHNVTLIEWDRESAISAAQQPHLAIVAMTRTNLSGIPDGLLQPLPAKLQRVLIAHSNLTSLPSDLHTKWHTLVTLYLEHSRLREFPKTLLSLPLRDLSLHANLIERIPELADMHQHYLSFMVSANPLGELPDSLGGDTSFKFFNAERTLLKTVPSWMRTSVSDTIYLYGTPYCESQTAEETACAVRNERVDGNAPMPFFDAKFLL